MPAMYSLVFSEEATRELHALPTQTDRRRVLAALQCLTTDPDSLGVGDAVDEAGRVNRIGLIGTVAFAYWTDHAMQRLRVLAIQSMVE
jgi:hypothetical protein